MSDYSRPKNLGSQFYIYKIIILKTTIIKNKKVLLHVEKLICYKISSKMWVGLCTLTNCFVQTSQQLEVDGSFRVCAMSNPLDGIRDAVNGNRIFWIGVNKENV